MADQSQEIIMIWLAWRQFRIQALIGALAIAALGIALAATGPQLARLSAASTSAAGFLLAEYGNTVDKTLYLAGAAVVLALPALIGIFWGAPLISREVLTGTLKLAWSQSFTRRRWLTVKLALGGLSAMAAAGLVSLLLTWWAGPIDRAAAIAGAGPGPGATRFNPLIFATRGVAPIGYAAFAFMLGVTLGLLIRRIVPAMAATLAIFAAVQIGWPQWIRQHLIAPANRLFSPTALTYSGLSQSHGKLQLQVSGASGNWVLSAHPVNAAGHLATALPAACHYRNWGPACLASHGIKVALTYQPASRFWAFQWYECGIFLALALSLAGFCYWWLRRAGG
jgi:hypothetical protein